VQKLSSFLHFLVVLLFVVALPVHTTLAAPKSSAKAKTANPKYAAIVIDANNGKTLYQENANARRYPASLTKMMTLYLLFEAMQGGRIAPETPIPVSEYAAARPPTKIGFKPGQTIAAEAAAKALITRSANDVASAVAEYLGGTETHFAKNMTAKARQLGMMNTNFANASGLPDNNNYSTARDMAILSLALREHFPQYYHLFNITSFSYRGQIINSHNRLVRNMKGVDGLKTGFIRASGFNVATSMRSSGKSLVGVVMGGRTSASRDEHMRSLLNRYIGKASTAKKSAPLVAKFSPLTGSHTLGQMAQFKLPDGNNAPIPVAKAAYGQERHEEIQVAAIEQLIEAGGEAGDAPLAFASLVQKPVVPAVKAIEELTSPHEQDFLGETVAENTSAAAVGEPTLSDREQDALLLAALANEYPGSQPLILTMNALLETEDLAAIAEADEILALERLPKTVKQFSDKRRGENKGLEQISDSEIAHSALAASDEREGDKQGGDEPEIDIFTTASISNGKKGWVIQIASAKTVREADIALYKALSTASDRLERAEPYLQLHDAGEERYYRARFAGFKSQKSALKTCVDLQSKAIECYVLED